MYYIKKLIPVILASSFIAWAVLQAMKALSELPILAHQKRGDTMEWKKGIELNKTEQKYVLSAYIHRFTGDNFPEWAKKPGRPKVTRKPSQKS